VFFFFFSSRRRHTRSKRDWSSDVCSSDLILYFYSGDISIQSQNNFYVPKKVKKQLSINLGLWFLLLAWGFYLDRYDLLYNSTGAAYGASYIDINVNLSMLWIVFALCLGLALLSLYQIYKARIT